MLEQFGPYQVVKKIGKGGMGTVYEGVHESTRERCAIKVLAEWITEDPDSPKFHEFLRLFKEEIETLKQLKHENIVRLTGFGEQEGRHFYTMELVEGPNLQELLKDGHAFPWEDVVEITIQVCAALKHAHDRGILHRDLKPANLIWSAGGEGPVKLADFGIARHALDQLSDEVIGTADYMSPEQAAAKPITSRSDLYSVGSVMYALLAKRPPFRGPSKTQVLDDLQSQTPLPVGRLVFGIPQELETIVSQLLQKDPADRIATATILAKRLKALLHAHRQGKLLDSQDIVPVDDDDFELSMPASSPTEIGQTQKGQTRIEDLTVVQGTPPETQASQDPRGAVAGFQETEVGAGSHTEIDCLEGPATSFTHVDSDGSSFESASDAPVAAPNAPSHRLSIAGLCLLIAALAGLGWWLIQPPPADEVYQEIKAVADLHDHSKWIDVRDAIDQFLRDYPDDPRAAEVAAWQADHEWYKYWRSLERLAKKQGDLELLAPWQAAFTKASRLDNNQSTQKALVAYQTIVDGPMGDGVSGEQAKMIAHLKHRVTQLEVSSPIKDE